MLDCAEYDRLLSAASDSKRMHLNTLLWQGEGNIDFAEVGLVWFKIITAAAITADEITAINALLSTHRMIFELNATTGNFQLISNE